MRFITIVFNILILIKLYVFLNFILLLKYLYKKITRLPIIPWNHIKNFITLVVLDFYSKISAKNICNNFKLCIKAIEVCTNKNFINLAFKGRQLAWSLQNPYVTRVPKKGITIRVIN